MMAALWRILSKLIPPPSATAGVVFTPITQSNRSICLDIINELRQHLGNPYNPLSGNSVFILAATSNITKLINALKIINMRVRAGRPLDPKECDWTIASITLDQFFISDDGYYIESNKILELVSEAEMLCELMQGAEDAEYDVPEHNHRMLTKTFVSLKSILAALLSVLADT